LRTLSVVPFRRLDFASVITQCNVVLQNPVTRHLFFNLCGGTLGTAATTGLLYQPLIIGDGDCGEIGGSCIKSTVFSDVISCNLVVI
jgi:hypothetical protein